MRNWETQIIQSISVNICSPEQCEFSAACVTSNYLCVNGYCSPSCQTNADCDIGLENSLIPSTGSTCDLSTGLCSVVTMVPTVQPSLTLLPTLSPTISENPTPFPSESTENPTIIPTVNPSVNPTVNPTVVPSSAPVEI